MGMVTLASLFLLGATGAYLALQYDWSAARAHAVVAEQVGHFTGSVWSLHMWAATLVVALAVLHALRAWVTGRSHVGGRRRWLAGSAALAVIVVAFFTGTILPWDQQGWEALQHVQFAAGVFGLDLLDADDPQAAPLGVVFLVHVLAVPLLLVAALAVHLWRGRAGRRQPRRWGRLLIGGARRAWPLAVAAVAVAVLVPPLHGPAPFPRLQLTKPDWPFLWLVPVQKAVGSLGLWALPLALGGVGALRFLPRISSIRGRYAIAAAVVAAWAALTVLGVLF